MVGVDGRKDDDRAVKQGKKKIEPIKQAQPCNDVVWMWIEWVNWEITVGCVV